MFGDIIITWYNTNKRDLPWRDTKDPYLIWLSEIILQQTRVEQGLSYYYKFAERFPTVMSLAAASEDEVLKLWQGLGYYSRARNLYSASKQIVNDFGAKFPSDFLSILSLKGIGDYTAAAISSFAFDLPHAVVDGNVFRLLSRYFGIETPVDTTEGKKKFNSLAQSLLAGYPPAIYNQAIMEFGARQCRPSSPDCSACPLMQSCVAFRDKNITTLPVKKNKTKTRSRYFHYLVIKNKESFYIKKRTGKDIWQGLHDFPLIETTKPVDEKKLFNSADWKENFRTDKSIVTGISPEYKHVLSHQLIHARFYEISSDKKTFEEGAVEWKKVNRETVKEFAVPRLIEEYLESMQDD